MGKLWIIIIIILLLLVSVWYFLFGKNTNTTTSLNPDNVVNVSTDVSETAESTASVDKSELSPDMLEEIFQNCNIYGVHNGPTELTTFILTESRHIYSIENYHWNDRSGTEPGTISLKSEDGKVYGPWQSEGRDGQGGVPNAYWVAYPNLELPAGTYTIIDSDNVSWSQNAQSNGQGMSRVHAVK